MVDVQVRAHDNVNVLSWEPGLGDLGKKRAVEFVPAGVVTLLVIANAGVDDDLLAAGLDQQA